MLHMTYPNPSTEMALQLRQRYSSLSGPRDTLTQNFAVVAQRKVSDIHVAKHYSPTPIKALYQCQVALKVTL